MRKRSVMVAFILSAIAVQQADAQLQEVVVTAARISEDDYSRIPAIVLERRADFLVQGIQLTNDTRASDARQNL
jgi:hypothetical protein